MTNVRLIYMAPSKIEKARSEVTITREPAFTSLNLLREQPRRSLMQNLNYLRQSFGQTLPHRLPQNPQDPQE